MQQMYDAKCKEYEELVEQFNQLQDEDQALINELEEKLHNTETKLAQAQNKQIYLQDDLKKLKNESSSQIVKLEKQISQKDEQIEHLQLKLNQLNRKIVELEIDADSHESRQRQALNYLSQLYEANRDLELKLDRVLEQLAMVQTDLEIQRNNGQDQIERLKMEIKDYQDELLATKRQRMSSCTSMTSVPEYAKLYQSIATVDTVRANAAGFNKSLTLISALIKDLDDKMTQIRVQKV